MKLKGNLFLFFKCTCKNRKKISLSENNTCIMSKKSNSINSQDNTSQFCLLKKTYYQNHNLMNKIRITTSMKFNYYNNKLSQYYGFKFIENKNKVKLKQEKC